VLVGVAAGQQVVAGLRLVLEDDSFEVEPEHGIVDRELADLLALREDRQAAAMVSKCLNCTAVRAPLRSP
jgi:hypothetical protein